MNVSEINRVVAILKREVAKWKVPAVGVVADRSKDPFLILISTVLSLRTKDKTTLEASNRLFSLATTPEKILNLPLKTIEEAIYPVGFYRTKAKSIRQICSDLIKKFRSRVPASMDDLLSLKGVGRKTANLVLTLGFDLDAICVDVHVHRISNRLGFIKTRTPEQSEMALRKKLPQRHWKIYNDLLVTFGQNLCTPLSPRCSVCKLASLCEKRGVSRSR